MKIKLMKTNVIKTNKLKKIILNSKFKKFVYKISIKHSKEWKEINITINNELQMKNHVENYNTINKIASVSCLCPFCKKWKKLERNICIFIEEIQQETKIFYDYGVLPKKINQIISTSKLYPFKPIQYYSN